MNAVIDELKQEHVEVLARIAAAEGQFADAGVCARFVAFLERDVVTHFRTEEEVLFPELARIPSIANGPLRIMNAEHDAFRHLLQAARQARQDGDGHALTTAATDLATLLQRHIAKEDGVLFPLALEMLTVEQLDRLDRREGTLRQSPESKGESGRP